MINKLRAINQPKLTVVTKLGSYYMKVKKEACSKKIYRFSNIFPLNACF